VWLVLGTHRRCRVVGPLAAASGKPLEEGMRVMWRKKFGGVSDPGFPDLRLG
jgi:hypothetical protein